ncbi:MAG: aor9 [Deltaproteobacteria bacterium]|nr:aor9 [Deltaproteobacteria bacterium]
MHGFSGKLLRVDLTKGSCTADDLGSYFKNYLGGRALNHMLLFRSADVATVAPFEPANPLVLGAGPLCGTTWPCSARLQARRGCRQPLFHPSRTAAGVIPMWGAG